MDTSTANINLAQADSLNILRPYRTLRNIYSPRTILVIASENCLTIPDDLRTFIEGGNGVHVRFTNKLPLPNQEKRPPIDTVVLIGKVFVKDSLRTIQESLALIDVRYFVGKCFVLITSDGGFCQSDVEEFETLASSYHLPVYFIPKTSDGTGQARLQIPSSLMSVYCPPAGNDVNSLVMNAAITRGAALLKDNPVSGRFD